MQTEQQCKPEHRYLFSDAYFSGKAVAIWQSECIKRWQLPKDQFYDKYINWVGSENEIAVFTLYAYADFSIPKKFDIIFELANPKKFLQINYELEQSIHEAWAPQDNVGHGHKHLCIFRFDNEVPGIFNILHKKEAKFSTVPKGQKSLGFCNSDDFDAITDRIEKVLALKALYGDKWWEYDDYE